MSLIPIILSAMIYAGEPNEDYPGFFPTGATQVNWVFTGSVANESGENFNYLFQLQRDHDDFHVTVALFDAQTKRILFQETRDTTIENAHLNNWSVGDTFLRFNPINDSWIFGMQDQHKKGFNFKVDMLSQPDHEPVTRYFRHGVSFIVVQTGQLNGHIRLDEGKEQFVTAQHAWFRQIWLSGKANSVISPNTGPIDGLIEPPLSEPGGFNRSVSLEKLPQLTGLLCRFNDGSGLYSIKVMEANAVRGAVAGFYDGMGVASAISQFIYIEQKQPDSWLIRITSPKMQMVLSDITQQNSVLSGFITEKNKSGFCMMSQDRMSL